MRKLIVLGVVLAALIGVDVVAKSKAEAELARKARAEAGVEARSSASIKSFPFVARLLAGGAAGDVTVTLHDVQNTSLKFQTVSLALVNVKLDKSQMFKGKAELTHIDRGTVTVVLDGAELSRVLHVPVTIADGKVTATVAGRQFSVTPTATAEGSVRLEAAGLPASLNVAVPQTRLISCPVNRVKVDDGALKASCDFKEIPPALLRAASRVVNG